MLKYSEGKDIFFLLINISYSEIWKNMKIILEYEYSVIVFFKIPLVCQCIVLVLSFGHEAEIVTKGLTLK